jgi:hypothetical protein
MEPNSTKGFVSGSSTCRFVFNGQIHLDFPLKCPSKSTAAFSPRLFLGLAGQTEFGQVAKRVAAEFSQAFWHVIFQSPPKVLNLHFGSRSKTPKE